MRLQTGITPIIAIFIALSGSVSATELMTPLSRSNEYFRKNHAYDFWALGPYYTGQVTNSSCSVASVTMVLNAARSSRTPLPDDLLITHERLLERVNDSKWTEAVEEDGGGIGLRRLGEVSEKSLRAYGFKKFRIEVVPAPAFTNETRQAIRDYLVMNEKSRNDFIIANFDLGVFTQDDSGGHIAPVGAYDEVNRRVLILDPDRDWFEPYWVSEDLFIQAVATGRGLVWIQLNE